MLPLFLRLLFLKIPKAVIDVFQDVIKKLEDSSFFFFYYETPEKVIFFPPSFSYNATSYSWKKNLEVITLLFFFFFLYWGD